MNDNFSLKNKTVLVVGAAGRIGRTVVSAVLSAGGRVMALDSDDTGLRGLDRSYGAESLHSSTVNIADPESIANAFADAHHYFGSVEGAVNTAYPRNAQYGRHFFDVEYADFCENTALHMGGYFLFMQMCARYALEHKQPFSLVNLSSIYGSIAPRFEVYANTAMTMSVEYAAIKAGIEHMTRFVNAYMKIKGGGSAFRANCVSPGGIRDGQDERFLENYRAHCMQKGMLDSSDVIGAIMFLLSEQSRFVVGQTLVVDDGFSL